MAKTLSFYKISSAPQSYIDGAIYFDETNHLIYVGNSDGSATCFSGVQSVSFNSTTKKLNVVKPDGTSADIDLGISSIQTAISGIVEVLGSTGTEEGSLRKRVADAEGEIDSLQTAVGDADSGLVHDVADHESRIDTIEGAGYITSDSITVSGIKSGDKIVSLDGKDITSTLKISYDSEAKEIKLLGIGDAQIGDAIDCSSFIADGILENAELVTLSDGEVTGKAAGKYFKFTWNSASGKDPVYVPMADFAVKSYSAGNDLDVDADGKFDIALDADINISGVNVGRLGTEVTKLTKGMSLSEILTAMLCKDIDAKVNVVPSLSAISGRPAAEYEVGSTVPAFTLSTEYSDGSFTTADSSLYSTSVFGDSDHNNACPMNAGCVVGNFIWTGTSESNTNTANVESFEITSAQTYKVKAEYAASTTVPKTLLKNDSEVNIPAGTTVEKSISISVYYKDFYGVIPSSNADVTVDGLATLDNIALGDGVKHSTSSFTINVAAGDKGVYIFTKSTIKSFMNGSDDFTADLKKVVVNYTHGTQVTSYNLYSFPNVAGYANATSYVVTLN